MGRLKAELPTGTLKRGAQVTLLDGLVVSEIDRRGHWHSIHFAVQLARSSIGSGRGPLKAERRVRFPYALPFIINDLQ